MTDSESTGAQDDRGLPSLLAALCALPADAVVEWADANSGPDETWCREWVDVLAPELQEPTRLDWLWTIDPPGDPDDTSPWTIRLPQDMDYWQLDGETETGTHFFAVVSQDPRMLTATDLGDVAVDSLGLRPEDPVGGLAWQSRRGWSTSAVSHALTAWVVGHTERADVTFRWNPRAAAAYHAELDALRADPGPHFLLCEDADSL